MGHACMSQGATSSGVRKLKRLRVTSPFVFAVLHFPPEQVSAVMLFDMGTASYAEGFPGLEDYLPFHKSQSQSQSRSNS